ncbi:MAG: ferritin-like domain-containing protein [Syntrophobacteraceae bacterium]
MELSNFGAVLTFAAELEAMDSKFYMTAIDNPALAEYRDALKELAAALRKNEKDLLRARRENVTEMILEPIYDFSSELFSADRSLAVKGAAEPVLGMAVIIETKAAQFYLLAAEKMRALPEVSRLLSKISKSRATNRMRLHNLVG